MNTFVRTPAHIVLLVHDHRGAAGNQESSRAASEAHLERQAAHHKNVQLLALERLLCLCEDLLLEDGAERWKEH